MKSSTKGKQLSEMAKEHLIHKTMKDTAISLERDLVKLTNKTGQLKRSDFLM